VTEIKVQPNNQPDQTANVLLVSQTPDLVRLVLATLARKGIKGMVTPDTGTALDFLDKNECAL
jgi:hypothetical protein